MSLWSVSRGSKSKICPRQGHAYALPSAHTSLPSPFLLTSPPEPEPGSPHLGLSARRAKGCPETASFPVLSSPFQSTETFSGSLPAESSHTRTWFQCSFQNACVRLMSVPSDARGSCPLPLCHLMTGPSRTSLNKAPMQSRLRCAKPHSSGLPLQLTPVSVLLLSPRGTAGLIYCCWQSPRTYSRVEQVNLLLWSRAGAPTLQ